jgi:hypothetical protein
MSGNGVEVTVVIRLQAASSETALQVIKRILSSLVHECSSERPVLCICRFRRSDAGLSSSPADSQAYHRGSTVPLGARLDGATPMTSPLSSRPGRRRPAPGTDPPRRSATASSISAAQPVRCRRPTTRSPRSKSRLPDLRRSLRLRGWSRMTEPTPNGRHQAGTFKLRITSITQNRNGLQSGELEDRPYARLKLISTPSGMGPWLSTDQVTIRSSINP